MISITTRGSTDKTAAYLNRMKRGDAFKRLERYGQMGVEALARATPVDSNLTATSWEYEVIRRRKSYTIIWRNTNVVSGVPVAILLQYGHATGTGGWVQGRDYINPAIRPVFDRIAKDVWKEVTRNA